MSLFDNENVQELLNGLIRIGEVSSVNSEKCTARVVFDDDDSIVSYDLAILQRNTFQNKDYQTVHVGEDVLCVFLPNGHEDGFIIGAFYAGEVTPPESSLDIRTIVFADGTKATYNRATHTLLIQDGETTVQIDRSRVAQSAPDEISLDSTTISITGSATVNVNGGSSINLVAPVVNLTMGATTMQLSGGGSTLKTPKLTIDGELECTGDVKAGGISLMNHTHPGDSGGSTGPAQ